jgi:glutamate-1-semialdehyde 2,1-aminomutase
MILAIVQARMGSTRLPGKVLKKVCGKPLIEILLHRLSLSKKIDKIIVATSVNKENDTLSEFVEKLGFDVFRGSEDDVLNRYYQAANLYKPNTILRITGDCPLIDPTIVDAVINKFEQKQVQYLNNVTPPTYPDGMDVEIFDFETLREAWKKTESSHDREHVSPYIRNNENFTKSYLINGNNYGHVRLTVDEPDDLKVVEGIINYFNPQLDFDLDDIMNLKKEQPHLFIHNKNIGRDEGSIIGSGQKLWVRAKHIIPGGNMLLSKRAEMFLPDKWPAYFSKAKGCQVWDMDGAKYTDMSIMGIGTNILGYGHPEVDEAVRKVVEQGNMSTFNCPEEVYLAERLIELHPWADMVRLARTGGEANAIAIRIARAASGKDKVAFCGYHGWHDWYLSANLGDERTLDGHLLPGLDPKGVPRNLKGSVLPFSYNNFAELEALVQNHEIGVIKMEVQRNEPPKDGFLGKIRKLATEKGIVLVFDECTSGFRETFGGLHKKYGVEPDLAVFGKALGNGYAITAVIGRREVMEAAQSTFISSTFWTERIGPAAGLKTLEIMEREQSWEQITKVGKQIGKRWKMLADKNNLPIEISGLQSLINFSIHTEDWLKYKTLITQEMLKQKMLASNAVYVCTKHTHEIVDDYFEKLEPLFTLIRECEDGRSIDELLEVPVCHAGFKRLN